MQSKLLVNRNKIDFHSPFYNQVQDLCFELFGKKAVIPDRDRQMITIICPISVSLTFDNSEPKIYFHSYFDCNKNLIREVEEDPYNRNFSRNQSQFCVYNYQDAERYLHFKKKEADLIKELAPDLYQHILTGKKENFQDFTTEYLLSKNWVAPILANDYSEVTEEEKRKIKSFLSQATGTPTTVDLNEIRFVERDDSGRYDTDCYPYIFIDYTSKT